MTKEEFTKSITYLGMAYNKEFKQSEVEQYYDFLNQYDYETFKIAVKSLIKECKFMPSISEMISKCEQSKTKRKFDILEKMKQDGYFKDGLEYDKTIKWLESGIIPSWFKEDMKKYNRLLLQDNQKLLN